MHIQGIEAKDLGKELSNTQYWYQGNVVGNLADKLIQESQHPFCTSTSSKLLLRTANGLYVVQTNLANAWNCCKNHKGNEKHPENFRGLSVETLVGDLNDLFKGHAYRIEVSKTLQNEWLTQSRGDEGRGRAQLASNLKKCHQNMSPVIDSLNELRHQYSRINGSNI